MEVKKWIGALGFCGIALAATAWLYMEAADFADGIYLYMMAMDLTEGDQIKQIILNVLIYAYGYVVMKALHLGKSEWWDAVLAYPAGVLCWCVFSSIVLILGIPYRFGVMLVILAGILGACIYKIKKDSNKIEIGNLGPNLLYALGAATLASSGIFFVYMSNDSLYYTMKYGEILAIDGAFSQNVSYWLTWIGITPTMISSLVSFLGLYSIYTIHHMMMISFVLFFMVTVYEKTVQNLGEWKSALLTLGVTGGLILTPAFFQLGQWVMSNTYYMVFMYIFMYVICEIQDKRIHVKGAYMFLSLILIFLTLSRSETMVTTCFLVICASILQLDKKDMLLRLLVPSVIMLLTFWLRIYMTQGYLIDGMLNVTTVAVIVLAMVGTVVYLWVIREWLVQKCSSFLPQLMLCGLVLLNVALFAVKSEKGLKNLNSFLHNMTNEYWGFFPWLVLFVYLVFASKSVKMNYWDLSWVGFILFNFGLCMGGSGSVRQGIGDSLNRLVCSIVPVVWFAIVVHINEFLGDRSEEQRKDSISA